MKNRMFKKGMSLVLTIVLVVSVFPISTTADVQMPEKNVSVTNIENTEIENTEIGNSEIGNTEIGNTEIGNADVWDGSVASAFAGGNGTKEEPYLISGGSQLAFLASQVNAGEAYSGVHFALTNHIWLNDIADFANWGQAVPKNSWTAIGGVYNDELDCYCAFQGIFDGAGYFVAGIYIDDASASCIGLFGGVGEEGVVKNVTVKNAYLNGENYIGAIVGDLYFGTMVNVGVTESVLSGETDIAGVCGYAYESVIQKAEVTETTILGQYTIGGIAGSAECSTLQYCHSGATITALLETAGYSSCGVGGIAGLCWESSDLIQYCYNTGDISITASWVYENGGIVGFTYGTVDNCYNSANIMTQSDSETYSIGGVTGALYSGGKITNSYHGGTVITTSDGDVYDIGGVVGTLESGASVSNCYYLEGSGTYDVTTGSILTDDAMRIADSFGGFDFKYIWEMDNATAYPYPELMDAPDCIHQWVNCVCSLCNQICTHDWTGENGLCLICGYNCTHSWNATQTECEICGQSYADSLKWNGSVADGFAGGDGTKENPYQIANGAQLAYFAQQVREGNSFCDDSYNVQYIVLTADIDLNNLPFASIGTENQYFRGCFDGQDYEVTGFYTTDKGFFGGTGCWGMQSMDEDSGRIENLHVTGNIVTTGESDVGGIVARAQGGNIFNCTFSGSITVTIPSYAFFGGIVGEMEQGYLIGCTSEAELQVLGDEYNYPRGVGGVLGGAEYTTPFIDCCINTGNVTGQFQVGGIVGYQSSQYSESAPNPCINCYNSGTITALPFDWGGSIGGIAGQSSNLIQNCYNSGTITSQGSLIGTPSVGAIAGETRNISNCYNSGVVAPDITGCEEVYVTDIIGYYNEDATLSMTEEQMGETEFVDTLNIWVAENEPIKGYVSFATWKQGEPYPVFGKGAVNREVAVEIFSQDVDGSVTSVGEVTLDGMTTIFKRGDSISVHAVYDGNEYRFIGWYANGDFTKVLSNNRNYEFDITYRILKNEVYSLTALYEKVENAMITVNGSGAIYTINGSAYNSENVHDYMPGTKITVAVIDTEDFAYWKNTEGAVVSTDTSYTFTVVGNMTLTAVFNRKLENKYTLIFMSAYGQIIRRQQLTLDEVRNMTLPKVPVKTGYDSGEWEKTPQMIAEHFESGNEVLIVYPKYLEQTEEYYVSVDYGEIEGTDGSSSDYFIKNESVVIVAYPPEEGMKFAYWITEDGMILSYFERYAFFVTQDMYITAVYVVDNEEMETPGIAEITAIVKQESVSGISFTATFSVPVGSKIDFAGVVATSDAAAAQNLTKDNATYVRGQAADALSGRFTWTKSNADMDTTWYVRAYLVYTDATGRSHTVYSSLVTAQYGNL